MRALLTVSAALLAAVAGAGCSSEPPSLIPGLRNDRPDPAKGISGGSFSMHANVFSIEMLSFLCSTGDVRLTSVRLYRPSAGMRLVQWGIDNQHRPVTNAITAGPLTRLGSFSSHAVTPRCHRAPAYAAVGLELHRTQPGPQSFLGLRVTYDSDGRQKVAYLWEQYHIHDQVRRA